MDVTTTISIGELINKIYELESICDRSQSQENKYTELVKIFEEHAEILNNLPDEITESIYRIIIEIRLLNDKLYKTNLLPLEQTPQCTNCKAKIMYIINKTLKQHQDELDKTLDEIKKQPPCQLV